MLQNLYISLIDTFCFIHHSESQIKCVATGDHAYAFKDDLENMRGRGQVIVVFKMWRVWSVFSKRSLYVKF